MPAEEVDYPGRFPGSAGRRRYSRAELDHFYRQAQARLAGTDRGRLLPAASIVSAMAWAYVRFGSLPQAQHVLSIKRWWWRLSSRRSMLGVRTILLGVIAGLATILNFCRESRAGSPGCRGSVGGIGDEREIPWALGALSSPPRFSSLVTAAGAAASNLQWACGGLIMKIGLVVFGSGYVLLAFLQADS